MKEYRKDVLTVKDIAYMMDPSVLKLDTTIRDVEAMVEACRKYDFGSCFCWPCYYPQLVEMLKGTNTAFGTSLAFPSGQESTETKVYMAHDFMKLNPVDIKAVREATRGTSLKVIIEAMVLTDEEIVKACELCIEGGADYVKTGTGFSKEPTSLHHVELIKATVGDRAKVKVAGGVRDLETLLKMYKRGACRFGIGLSSAVKIIEEAIAVGHDIDMSEID